MHPQVRVKVWFGLGLELKLEFGAIFLGDNCPRTVVLGGKSYIS